MTIEEKAKAYDEAIKELRAMMPNWENLSYNGKTFLQDLVHIIPELKESESERIRKELLSVVNGLVLPYEQQSRFVAWLKKQESVEEIVERCKTSWYNEGKIQGQIEGLTNDEKYQQGWHDALEKQGEQKPAEWSDEDEYCIHQLIVFCENCMITDSGAKRCAHWLKSLRGRFTWKPSDEQMEAFANAWETYCGGDKAILSSLYNDLKNLTD